MVLIGWLVPHALYKSHPSPSSLPRSSSCCCCYLYKCNSLLYYYYHHHHQDIIAQLSAGEPYGRVDDGPRCFAYRLKPGIDQSYCKKINSISSYMTANRDVSVREVV